MTLGPPILIDEPNLSWAWAHAFRKVMERPERECPPLVVSIGGFAGELPPEDETLRRALDQHIDELFQVRVDTTAMLVFPYKFWRVHSGLSCRDFSDRCLTKLLPRLRKLDRRNRRGTYFERMMAFPGVRKGRPCVVDQLDEVVARLTRGRSAGKRFRTSGLQITCFDPARDHCAQPRLGFPCLQQVGLTYEGRDGLCVTGLYPSQHIFSRAYGNYLGLAHLGRFLCDQAGLELRRVVCIAMHPLLGVGKAKLAGLKAAADHCLEEI